MGNAFAPRTLTGMALPLAVWALHFATVYGLQGLACAEGWQRWRVAGMEATIVLLLLITLAALVVIGWLALRARGAIRDAEAAALRSPVDERRRFVARATLLCALLAAIAVLFTAVPMLMLRTCT